MMTDLKVVLHCLLFFFFGLNGWGQSLPNIIVINVDDLGETDLGVYGNEFIETPSIDALAKAGMRWTNAYSAAPICSPSRAALLTGKHPARIHFTGHITSIGRHRHPVGSRIIPPNDLMFIPLEENIIPEMIQSKGYVSVSIGKWHVGPTGYWPLDMGFDYNIGGWTHGSPPSHFYPYTDPEKKWNPDIPTLQGGSDGEYLADRLTTEALTFIKNHKDQPFFIYLPYYAVHTPLQAPESLVKKYQKKQKTNQKNEAIDPVYAAMVENLDHNIGRLVRGIAAQGVEEHTVIIFTSDNGAVASTSDMKGYRAGKGHLYEGGLRVPFMIKWPDRIRPGQINSRRTRTEDIAATINEIAGVADQFNANLDGRSLVGEFSGGSEEQTEEPDFYWYYPHYAPQGNDPGASIISGDYKYMEFYDPQTSVLYNLKEDPGEQKDLAKEMPEKIIELRGKLNLWLHNVQPIPHTMNPNYQPTSGK